MTRALGVIAIFAGVAVMTQNMPLVGLVIVLIGGTMLVFGGRE